MRALTNVGHGAVVGVFPSPRTSLAKQRSELLREFHSVCRSLADHSIWRCCQRQCFFALRQWRQIWPRVHHEREHIQFDCGGSADVGEPYQFVIVPSRGVLHSGDGVFCCGTVRGARRRALLRAIRHRSGSVFQNHHFRGAAATKSASGSGPREVFRCSDTLCSGGMLSEDDRQ